MKVSVVIPMYNSAPFIEKTLQCVLAQDYQDFEVVVVNDGSTDGSSEVVRAIGDFRLRVIDKPNSGVSDARNTGCRAAVGEYIATLDSDDYWYPDHLSQAVAFLDSNPDVMWYGASQISLPFGHPPPEDRGPERTIVRRHFFIDGNRYIHSSSMVYRREVFDESGGFPVGMAYFEDWVFQSRIACEHPILGANKRITSVYFRERPESATMNYPDDLCANWLLFLREVTARATERHIKYPLWVYERLRIFYRMMLFKCTKKDLLAYIVEFKTFQGVARTCRWRFFVSVAYALSGERLKVLFSEMPSMRLGERFKNVLPVYREHGISSAMKWFVVVVLYFWRGVMDSIQDRVDCTFFYLTSAGKRHKSML